MKITKLDLGGTKFCDNDPVDPGWVVIDHSCQDRSTNRKGSRKYKLSGDYTYCPFPDNTFEEVYGGCFLEFDENTQHNTQEEILQQFREIFRVMAPGAVLIVSTCNSYCVEAVRRLQYYGQLAKQVGFITDLATWTFRHEEGEYIDPGNPPDFVDGYVDEIQLTKPEVNNMIDRRNPENWDRCQVCGKRLDIEVDDYVDDYGVIACRSCLTPEIRAHINHMWDTDPTEDDHR